MKTIIYILLLAGLITSKVALAQGTLYFSNLSQPSGGNFSVGSDSWGAAIFVTGTNSGGYTLNSVQLLTAAASGSPGDIAVSIYNFSTSNPGLPGTSLGSLSGSDPVAGGTFTYISSGIMLLPAKAYFIVVTSATPLAQGSFNWSIANAGGFNSTGGWGMINGYGISPDGFSWGIARPFPLQFAVNATAVPEPSTLALAGLGLVCLIFRQSGCGIGKSMFSTKQRNVRRKRSKKVPFPMPMKIALYHNLGRLPEPNKSAHFFR